MNISKKSVFAKCLHISDGAIRWHIYCEGNSHPELVVQKIMMVYTVITIEDLFICRST